MNLAHRYTGLDLRSRKAAKGIVLSLVAKGISIICTILIVPLTIEFIDPTQYGIWLTMSSIIGWIAFFDLGLGNGFRNKFAEAKARGDIQLAREYVSTTYFAVTAIVVVLYSILLITNNFVNWTSILKLDPGYEDELHWVFLIVSAFFCMSLVANLFATLLSADQEPGYAAITNGLGQIMSLLTIFILTKTTEGSLLKLSLFYSCVPCLTMIICSLIAFCCTRYRQFSPSSHLIRIPLIKSILGKGIQFFLISICLIVIFQMMNIVVSREAGPLAVTEYNVAFKYFIVLNMMMGILIIPFWSAFTDAYTLSDTEWMKKTIRSMERIFLLFIVAACVMLILAQPFYRIWLGKDSGVNVPFKLSLAMAVYVLARSLGDLYMNMINGIGTIRIQLITYLGFAFISWPCMTWCCRAWGGAGVLVVPILTCLAQAVLCKIQLTKITNLTAKGIWTK